MSEFNGDPVFLFCGCEFPHAQRISEKRSPKHKRLFGLVIIEKKHYAAKRLIHRQYMPRATASAGVTEISSTGTDESNLSSMRSRTSRTSSQALLFPAIARYSIHRTSGKRNSANFALTEFYEVRHSPGPTPMSVQDSD